MDNLRNDLRTPYAIHREARELEIYNEFQALSVQPGAMKTRVTEIICKKYGINSAVTVLMLRKRVEKRLASQNASEPLS